MLTVATCRTSIVMLFSLFILSIIAARAVAVGPTQLVDIRYNYYKNEQRTRITLEFDREANYDKIVGNTSVEVILQNSLIKPGLPLPITSRSDDILRAISRSRHPNGGHISLTFILRRPVKPKFFTLQNPHRLVLDFSPGKPKSSSSSSTPPPPIAVTQNRRDRSTDSETDEVAYFSETQSDFVSGLSLSGKPTETAEANAPQKTESESELSTEPIGSEELPVASAETGEGMENSEKEVATTQKNPPTQEREILANELIVGLSNDNPELLKSASGGTWKLAFSEIRTVWDYLQIPIDLILLFGFLRLTLISIRNRKMLKGVAIKQFSPEPQPLKKVKAQSKTEQVERKEKPSGEFADQFDRFAPPPTDTEKVHFAEDPAVKNPLDDDFESVLEESSQEEKFVAPETTASVEETIDPVPEISPSLEPQLEPQMEESFDDFSAQTQDDTVAEEVDNSNLSIQILVRKLANSGLEAPQIAQQLGLTQEEVELVLSIEE